MAYLPDELPKAKVLITVKTYPLPSRSYTELVCTAGLLNGEQWIRIYPVSFRFLQDSDKYPKYSWVELNLVRRTRDFRPESYRPKLGVDERITVTDKIGTGSAHDWAGRKSYVLKETFTSMNELIQLAKSPRQKSLATLKPTRIVDFIVEEDEREWKQEWLDQLKQLNMFDIPTKGGQRKVVKKLPYKFSYRFFLDTIMLAHLTFLLYGQATLVHPQTSELSGPHFEQVPSGEVIIILPVVMLTENVLFPTVKGEVGAVLLIPTLPAKELRKPEDA